MQVLVSCHRCNGRKRPLAPCPACHAAALAEPELHAWRIGLHAEGLERITRTPVAADLPQEPIRAVTPLRAVVVLDDEPTVASQPATIIPLEPPLPPEETRSFDWEDRGRRLRRSA